MQPLYLRAVFSADKRYMKNLLTIACVCFHALSYAQETETRNIGSFSGVKAAEGVSVYLKRGDKESARVEVSETSLTSVITEISGSYLKVHMKDGNYRNANAKVYVTYVHIDKLSASSAGGIYTDTPIKSNNIEINASSAGTVELELEAGMVEVNASSAGDVELKGKAQTLRVYVSSAGEVDTYDLKAENVNVNVSTGGTAKVSVIQSLQAHAGTGGSIRYRGNPGRATTNSTTGGSVKKTN